MSARDDWVRAYNEAENREGVPEDGHDREGRADERLEHHVESLAELVRLVLQVQRMQVIVETWKCTEVSVEIMEF